MRLAIRNRLTDRSARELRRVWPVLAACAACWLLLAFVAVGHLPALCFGTDDPSVRASATVGMMIQTGLGVSVLLHWSVMAGAMMLPLLVPAARHVSVRSFERRRLRSQAMLVAGFWLVWSLTGIAALALVAAAVVWSDAALWIVGLVSTAAVLWQLSNSRMLALRRCAGRTALRPRGIGADWDCTAYGMGQALSCARTCLPAMLAMTLSPVGHIAALPMTWLLLRERGRRSGRGWAMAALIAVLGASAMVGRPSHPVGPAVASMPAFSSRG